MRHQDVSRRTVLKGGGAALAGLTVLRVAGPAHAFPGHAAQEEQNAGGDVPRDQNQDLGNLNGDVIPWLDQPPPSPIPDNAGKLLIWEAVDSWYTPADDFFFVNHYGQPGGLDEATWRVGIDGLVEHPQSLSVADIKARPRREVDFTLECSGNTGTSLDFFIGGVGNARWGGARLAPLLEQAGLRNTASEVIFWGADSGTVTIRDNGGIVSAGKTGTLVPDGQEGFDLRITEQFARSMPLREALGRDKLLCYQMNGGPLPPEHGFPVRLIAPGWYGVANVKWLTRIEVVDQPFAGQFMARDYVSIREQQRGDETVWTFATVTHDRLKSAPAKVIRRGNRYIVLAAAWGAPIAAVEVRIDEGPWLSAQLIAPLPYNPRGRRYAWSFWTFEWGTPAAGEHRVTTRAFDVDGNVQPAPNNPFLASKRTFWESNGRITRRVLIP